MTPDRIRAIIKEALADGRESYALATAGYYAERGDLRFLLELCADHNPQLFAEYMAHAFAQPRVRMAMLEYLRMLDQNAPSVETLQ